MRVALYRNGVAHTRTTHDRRTGAQRDAADRALNPQALVAALETKGGVPPQSPAILEWIKHRYPAPALLPSDPAARAVVRVIAAVIGCYIHPFGNPPVLTRLRERFGGDEAAVAAWIARWIDDGFAALKAMVATHGAGFADGDAPTLADCYLVRQLYAAERFAVDLSRYQRLVAAARALPAFADAHPTHRPDADA